jgi:hypothetical protein
MKSVPFTLGLALITATASGAPDSAAPTAQNPPAPHSTIGDYFASILPRGFQKNPKIFMTVITEMTPYGRRVAPPTEARPTYYLATTSGYHDEGMGVTGERPVPVPELLNLIKKSLSTSHFIEASPGHPPTIVVSFFWGSHNTLDQDDVGFQANLDRGDPMGVTGSYEDMGHRNLISRAALVGGVKFAQDLAKVLNDQDDLATIGMLHPGRTPLEVFAARNAKTRELLEQAMDDCYYVVAGAYDGAALAKGQHKLLWRTKMTTNSRGLAMGKSLQALISAGGPFFGKDMAEPATLEQRLLPVPEGRVDVGTPVEVNPGGKSP